MDDEEKSRTLRSAEEGQRDVCGWCFLKSPTFKSLSQRAHSLSFGCTWNGAESSVCLLRADLRSGTSSPGALLQSVRYATKLGDNRKKLQIKNTQKKRQRSFPSLT